MHVYPRVIPVLLLDGGERLVKTRTFGDAATSATP